MHFWFWLVSRYRSPSRSCGRRNWQDADRERLHHPPLVLPVGPLLFELRCQRHPPEDYFEQHRADDWWQDWARVTQALGLGPQHLRPNTSRLDSWLHRQTQTGSSDRRWRPAKRRQKAARKRQVQRCSPYNCTLQIPGALRHCQLDDEAGRPQQDRNCEDANWGKQGPAVTTHQKLEYEWQLQEGCLVDKGLPF